MAKSESAKGTRSAPVRRGPFTCKVEGAKEVVLTGEFTKWAKDKTRLQPAGQGQWSTVLELPPGEYRYRLLVDGQWCDHPEAQKRVPNPFGSDDCVLVVA